MGMFDYVRCEYPLPGDMPEHVDLIEFQTKDLDQALARFVITKDGCLLREDGSPVLVTTTIWLYSSNVVQSGHGIYTRSGEDAYFLEYVCEFVSGKLESVKEVENRREPALAVSFAPPLDDVPTPEERDARKQREREHLLGRDMYVWWGVQDLSYPAKIIAENGKELVAQKPTGEFEILRRTSRDVALFDSYEEAMRFNEDRQRKWDEKKRRYEELLAARRR